MSESKTKLRYWITFLLDDVPEGEKFQPGLLHITIIPWFVADISEQDIIKSFKDNFSSIKRIDATIGGLKNFGENKEVAVSLVEPSAALLEIHKQALKWLEEINARWAVKNAYAGDEFKPHIRWRSEAKLQQSDILHLNSLTLVKAARQEDNIRVVAKKVSLK